MKKLSGMFAAVLVAILTSTAAQEADWQTLSVGADASSASGQKPRCEMKVPAQWQLNEKGAASSQEFAATLVLEAEKPEAWWTKRKKVDFKGSRMFQDTRTNYWIQLLGALMSGSDDGTTYIIGVRDGNLVCHAVLEFKSDDWGNKYGEFEGKYAEVVRQMVTSLKPLQ